MTFLIATMILGFVFLCSAGIPVLGDITEGDKPNPSLIKIIIWSSVAILSSAAILSFLPDDSKKCSDAQAEVQDSP